MSIWVMFGDKSGASLKKVRWIKGACVQSFEYEFSVLKNLHWQMITFPTNLSSKGKKNANFYISFASLANKCYCFIIWGNWYFQEGSSLISPLTIFVYDILHIFSLLHMCKCDSTLCTKTPNNVWKRFGDKAVDRNKHL